MYQTHSRRSNPRLSALVCLLLAYSWPTATLAETPAALQSGWYVTSIDNLPVQFTATSDMVFTPEGVEGNAGCNDYQGRTLFNEDQLILEDIKVGDKYCEDVLMNQEQRLLQTFSRIAAWRQEADRLWLLDGNDHPIVELEKTGL